MLAQSRAGVKDAAGLLQAAKAGLSNDLRWLFPPISPGRLRKSRAMVRLRDLRIELAGPAMQKKAPQKAFTGSIAAH